MGTNRRGPDQEDSVRVDFTQESGESVGLEGRLARRVGGKADREGIGGQGGQTSKEDRRDYSSQAWLTLSLLSTPPHRTRSMILRRKRCSRWKGMSSVQTATHRVSSK